MKYKWRLKRHLCPAGYGESSVPRELTWKSLLWDTVMPSMVFWYLYTIWLIHIRNFTGQWVYPFFAILDDTGEY